MHLLLAEDEEAKAVLTAGTGSMEEVQGVNPLLIMRAFPAHERWTVHIF